jgi:regulator of protease activity HflC (stomatin/prohibitin superfamily)
MFLEGSAIFVLVLVLFVIILIAMGVKTVPQGHEYTTERFGRYTRTLQPGLRLIVPIMDRVGDRRRRLLPGPRRGQGGL